MQKKVTVLISAMGYGQSREESKHAPLSSRFSTMELQKLEQFFDFKQKVSGNNVDITNNISSRVTKCFSEGTSKKILRYLEISIFKDSRASSSESFLLFIFHLTKDCVKELSSIIFDIATEGGGASEKNVFTKFISDFVNSMLYGASNAMNFPSDEQSSYRLAERLLESCPEKITKSVFEDTLHRTPLLVDILQFKFRMTFFDYVGDVSEEMRSSMPYLIPELEIKEKSASKDIFILPIASVMYINARVPMGMQHKWRLLYSTKLHGESFSKLTGAILNRGPTILVVNDQEGHVFGGFASSNWEFSSQFQGTEKSFLFSSEPSLGVYDCLGGSYNDHYMYLNIGQETMPNGLGMGGQFDFFGLWLDQEFGIGHSKAKPLCTTYKSPQLSKSENFKIEALNVWGVGEEPKKLNEEEDNEMTSVLDKHIEAKALLEIAGKPRVSEGLRDAAPDSDIPETKELHHAHDPMT